MSGAEMRPGQETPGARRRVRLHEIIYGRQTPTSRKACLAKTAPRA